MNCVLELKQLLEHGDLSKVIERYSSFKIQSIIDSLSLQDQLKCSFYRIFSLNILGRSKDLKEIALRENFLTFNEVNYDKLALLIWYRILMTLGHSSEEKKEFVIKYYETINNLINTLSEDEEITYAEWINYTCNAIAWNAVFSNYFTPTIINMNNVHSFLKKSLMLSEKTNNKFCEINTLIVYANIYYLEEDYQSSINYLLKSLNLAQAINSKERIFVSLSNLGECYLQIGDLENASKCLEEAFILNKSIGRISEIGLHLGKIHAMKGEITEALTCFKNSLIQFQNVNMYRGIAESYNAIATLYFEIGELETSKINFSQILSSLPDYCIDCKHIILYKLLSITLAENNKLLATNYKNQIIDYLNEKEIKYKEFYLQITNALFYKNSRRFQDRVIAQNLFKTALLEKIPSNLWKTQVLSHLIEMLLEEFQLLGEIEILQEITELINQLSQIGKKASNYRLSFEIVILKAKLFLAQGRFMEASNLFEKALNIAEEKNLLNLKEKILTEIDRKEEFVNNMPLSTKERIKKLNIELYILQTQKFFDYVPEKQRS